MLLATSPSRAITVVRVTLGVIFFAPGSQKVLSWFVGYGLKGTTGYFVWIGPLRSLCGLFLRIPGRHRPGAGVTDTAGGLAIIAMMAGAIVKVHWQNGFLINWELSVGRGHGFEANMAFIAMALACVITGGGALSLDALLAR